MFQEFAINIMQAKYGGSFMGYFFTAIIEGNHACELRLSGEGQCSIILLI